MKKALIYSLSLALLLSLTACHKPQADQQEPSQPEPATTSTPADVSTPEPVKDNTPEPPAKTTPEPEPEQTPATPTEPEDTTPAEDTTPQKQTPEPPKETEPAPTTKPATQQQPPQSGDRGTVGGPPSFGQVITDGSQIATGVEDPYAGNAEVSYGGTGEQQQQQQPQQPTEGQTSQNKDGWDQSFYDTLTPEQKAVYEGLSASSRNQMKNNILNQREREANGWTVSGGDPTEEDLKNAWSNIQMG